MKTSVAACGAALTVAGLLGAGLTGCSAKVETSTKSAVSAEDLQKKVTDQLTEAGNAPKSVTCDGELVAEVGKSTMCDAVFSDVNSVQAKVTVTAVKGSELSFELSPSLTKDQLVIGKDVLEFSVQSDRAGYVYAALLAPRVCVSSSRVSPALLSCPGSGP